MGRRSFAATFAPEPKPVDLGIRSVYLSTLARMLRQAKPLLAVYLVIYAPFRVFDILGTFDDLPQLMVSLGVSLLTICADGAVIVLLHLEPEANIKQLLRRIYEMYLPLLLVWVVRSIPVNLVGLIAFFLGSWGTSAALGLQSTQLEDFGPVALTVGVLLGVTLGGAVASLFAVAPLVAVTEDVRSPFSAIFRSRDMARGRVLRIMAVFGPVVLPYVAVDLAVTIVSGGLSEPPPAWADPLFVSVDLIFLWITGMTVVVYERLVGAEDAA